MMKDPAIHNANMAVLQATLMVHQLTEELIVLRHVVSKLPDAEKLKASAIEELTKQGLLPLPTIPTGTT